ncbi:Hsp70 family protein [Streptomyces viridochromogenes]|uniref:Hsp70 family protein n=1 Tax=Streptomyces viridochromogenes TaxID=1938 RepID=UPI00069F3C78|nr:Hsp70 family protein [Streptomyces viridochromogenes]
MRETIDFGIDLGTAHSAIAVAENGRARVLKNGDGRDRTPSAVWMPREGTTHVGRKARERVESDPDDAHTGFKSRMGVTGADFGFRRAGVSLTPEQLSAEVLKSLCRDAAHALGEPPAAAVIAVPAGCSPGRAAATGRAAVLAGLSEHCPLLPEPVAAALAYGAYGTDGADGASGPVHRMVFGLGGGDFTAAVVAERGGEFRLLRHVGDPRLGGTHLDWAVVDELLAPAVESELGLRDFVRGNPRWRTNFARLRAAAETAKTELSRARRTEIIADLKDDDGHERPFLYTLTRGALDDLALPSYARAVEWCRNMLADASLRPDHIDRLLLVGGGTLAPGLRELLADPRQGLGIPLDHSQDPTTVVARGAALHAGTVRVPVRRPRPAATAEITDLLRELRGALGTCESHLDRAGREKAGGFRTLVGELQLTVDRFEDAHGAGGGPHTAALMGQLLERIRQFEGALLRDPMR